MVRKKDRFWEHVKKQNKGRFKCNYCESIFAGGATRIKYHLAGAKGHDINICTKVPKEVQEEASLTIGEPNKKLKGASTSNKDKEREISSTSISKDDMLSGVFEKREAEYIAEILLGVFVEGLLAKMRSIVIEQHISFELGFKEGLTDLFSGLTDLFSLLTKIQLVLNDVEKRQASDEFLRRWLAELRRVAYDIDDVLDKFGYNILQQKGPGPPQAITWLRPCKKLILHGSRTLNSLPDEIKLFPALEELRIQNFNGMEALPDWFSYLSSLQKLSFRCCKKLMYLPIPHLTNLKHLRIDDCRNLEKICAGGSGAEWFQIAHVPNIKINGKYIKEGEDSEDSEDSEDFDWDYFDDSEDEYDPEDEVDDSEDEVEDSEDSHYNLQEDSILENNQLDDNWCQGTSGLENNQLDDN